LISKIFKKPEPEVLTKIKQLHSTGGHLQWERERDVEPESELAPHPLDAHYNLVLDEPQQS
jgi:hypothetical protein